ncbi:MAG: hypothetical protein ABI601_01905 [bacterium]
MTSATNTHRAQPAAATPDVAMTAYPVIGSMADRGNEQSRASAVTVDNEVGR